MKHFFILVLSLTICMFTANSHADKENPFARFIRPVSNPVYNLDARNQTYFSVIHMYQKLPGKIKTTLGKVRLGGKVNITAVQLGYAFNERFSIVAEKTGYIDFDPNDTLENENGWGDYGAGLKYSFIYDPEKEFILTGRLLFEFTQGSRDVFQGNGDGNVSPSITFLKGLDKFQVGGTIGAIIPFDGDEESTIVYDNWHLSYAVTEKVFPLIELNHFCVVDEGRRKELVASIAEFEGGDLINLGSHHAKRNKHLVTLALGCRYRCMKNMDFGLCYEFPLTDKNENLMRDRITVDLVYHF